MYRKKVPMCHFFGISHILLDAAEPLSYYQNCQPFSAVMSNKVKAALTFQSGNVGLQYWTFEWLSVCIQFILLPSALEQSSSAGCTQIAGIWLVHKHLSPKKRNLG